MKLIEAYAPCIAIRSRDMSNTHEARRARRKKKATAGGVEELRAHLWSAVETAAQIVQDDDECADRRLRAIHATTQASASYLRVIEATEFEARLKALEERAPKS